MWHGACWVKLQEGPPRIREKPNRVVRQILFDRDRVQVGAGPLRKVDGHTKGLIRPIRSIERDQDLADFQ
jgi:hypothetical protein